MLRLAALLAVLALALAAAPAGADTGSLHDPRGDASDGPEGAGLDVTRASFDNGADRLVVTVTFAEVTAGALIVSVAPRGGPGLRLISKYRPHGPARSFVVAGSFDDVDRPGTICPAFRARWDEDAAEATLTMPARCLAHAEYGDLRFGVLTERGSGDTDYAPEDLSTGWVGRG